MISSVNDQIRRKERIWSHLLKKSLIENFIFRAWKHSHKKRKDSLEGNLDRVLFVTEREFPNTLVPRLPHHTSNINSEFAEKSKTTVFFLCDQLLGALIHLNLFLIDDAWCKLCSIWLLLCENNCGSIIIPELNTGGKYCCSYYSRQGDR